MTNLCSICVHCGSWVDSLYTSYGENNIALNVCKKCNMFTDPYIEHDFILIFLDLILHKPAIYKHLIYNRFTRNCKRLNKCDPEINPSVLPIHRAKNFLTSEHKHCKRNKFIIQSDFLHGINFKFLDNRNYLRYIILLILLELHLNWSEYRSSKLQEASFVW